MLNNPRLRDSCGKSKHQLRRLENRARTYTVKSQNAARGTLTKSQS
jgi:hypothetical protein